MLMMMTFNRSYRHNMCCLIHSIKQLNFWLLYMQIGSDFFFNKKHKEDSFKIYIIMKNIDTEIY